MTMFLRHSNAKLQEELRDTMKAYMEEKSLLRAHLANLRLDVNELHTAAHTITTDDSASHHSLSNTSEPELKTLVGTYSKRDKADGKRNGNTATALQLPTISIKDDGKKKQIPRSEAVKHKNLRFQNMMGSGGNNAATTAAATIDMGCVEKSGSGGSTKSFLDVDEQEQNKFMELQRNQDVMRSIRRGQLKEKRTSLIRLPTINSACKRRGSVWDSGENVSRPKGKGSRLGQFEYVHVSQELSKKVLKIPDVKDSQRSEIKLSGKRRGESTNKRKVHFTRPRPDEEDGSHSDRQKVHDVSKMGGESLNTTLADTTLDTTNGDISLDEEIFRALAQKRLDDTRTTKLSTEDPTLESDQISIPDQSNDAAASGSQKHVLPPLDLKPLAKKNLMLHNQQMQTTMRRSPTTGRIQKLNAGRTSPGIKSIKSSDKSIATYNTKTSRLSQETEEWKAQYMKYPDPEKKNKTLSDIMFAVRTRMRDNEESLRFGETPRPVDQSYFEYLPTKVTPRHSNNVNKTPRRSKAVAATHAGGAGKRTARGGVPAFPALVERKQNAAQIQTYLKKMYRQRRNIDRMAGEPHRMAHFAGHSNLQMVAQEA